ncbi:MAG: putative Zn finger-like uncharacterized protein [Paracoccaceae bacterium]|jgi:predicted Zn finger-like uncharacterized protein
MLVSCPTCPAEYEIAESDVGPEGRVVECSACGARWLQPSAVAPAAPAGDSAIPGMAEARRTLDEIKADPADAPDEGLRRESLYGHDDEDVEDDAPAPPVNPTPMSQLRAAAEPTPIRRGAGPDLRPARSLDEDETQGGGLRRGGRELPDAARLNAELRASAHEEEAVDRGRRSGFRTGLLLVVVIGGIGAGLYYGKDQIAVRLPAAEPTLNQYIATVDSLKLQAVDLIEMGKAKIMPMINGEKPAAPAPAPAPAAPTAAPTPAPAAPAQTPADTAPAAGPAAGLAPASADSAPMASPGQSPAMRPSASMSPGPVPSLSAPSAPAGTSMTAPGALPTPGAQPSVPSMPSTPNPSAAMPATPQG